VAHLAALDAVMQVGRRQQSGSRADHRSQLDRRQHDLPEGRHVGQHHEHPVAAVHAAGPQVIGDAVGTLGKLGEAELRLAPFVVHHPERRAVVAAGVNVEVVERPVELLERRPAEAGVGRGVVVAMSDQEITGFQESAASVHGGGSYTSNRFRRPPRHPKTLDSHACVARD